MILLKWSPASVTVKVVALCWFSFSSATVDTQSATACMSHWIASAVWPTFGKLILCSLHSLYCRFDETSSQNMNSLNNNSGSLVCIQEFIVQKISFFCELVCRWLPKALWWTILMFMHMLVYFFVFFSVISCALQ